MKRNMKIKRRQLELLKDFIKLWRNYNRGEKPNYYDIKLIEILEEYEDITRYRQEWRRRND